MKTSRLTIGVISIVLFVFVSFQSCAAGLGNALAENGENSGTAGMLVAFCLLIAGIVGICNRKSIKGGYVTAVFYAFGGLMGITNYGSYSDLKIWSILCFIFAAIFVLGSIKAKKKLKNGETPENEN